MRKLIVSERVTLDGVFDADTMDQWFMPYHSDDSTEIIKEGVLACDIYLLGRRTYEMLAPYWSRLKNNEMGVADKLNSVSKYVVSSTLQKADWHNSTIIKNNVVAEITRLKEQPGQEILIHGSAALVQSLLKTDLIDEYRFLVSPIIMGSGKRFFKDGSDLKTLKLVDAKMLDKGVLALIYQPGERE
jgi:dihydrofolate reductase